MEAVHDDCFVVFVRDEDRNSSSPQAVERPLAACASYEEACRVRNAYSSSAGECVIRYIGPAGGGD